MDGGEREILSRVTAWGERETPVRALLLVGSRAQNDLVDELSDFDVSVFAATHEPYTENSHWLSAIGRVWVCVPEKFTRRGEIIPTRLVIFEGGVKVDFAFYGLHVLRELADSDELDAGYRILLDKDGTARSLRPPSFGKLKHDRPTEEDFVSCVNEFWFEAYHVAKYLRRNELWLVKFRDWSMKTFLLKMIEWHEQSRHNWDYETFYMGKRMQSWASETTWESLSQAFAHFARDDSWSGLTATMNLFRRLAIETSEALNFAYPQTLDEKLTEFVLQIKEEQR